MPISSLAWDFFAQARRHPVAPALRSRTEVVTYAELAELTENALTTVDGGTGPVAVLARKSPGAVAVVLAGLAANRPILLPPVDLGRATLGALCERVRCTQVLAVNTPEPGQADLVTDVVQVGSSAVGRPAGPTAGDHTGRGRASDRDVSFLLTTSGSTGVPKIVPLSVGAVSRFTQWAGDQFGFGLGTTALSFAPLNFDLSLLEVWTTLRYGGCVAMVEPERAVHPQHLTDLITAAGVNVIQAVPMLYRILLDAPGGPSFPAVTHVVVTGDHAPPSVRAGLPRLFPRARLYNIYGCTETNDSFLYEFNAEEALASPALPIGRPLPGVWTSIVDSDDQAAEGTVTGELLVSTPFQTLGYLGGGSDRFVVRPDGRTYFRTGDLVHRDDAGRVTVLGRRDFEVKVRGVRVNLEEIERIILDHEEVIETAVVAVADDIAGRRLHATVRAAPSGTLTALRLREHCAARLPRVAIPAEIRLVGEPLPRTSTGKVDRTRIRSELGKGRA
ncbi:MAG: AMP-binding protein [Micromonosporaceae bacterium]